MPRTVSEPCVIRSVSAPVVSCDLYLVYLITRTYYSRYGTFENPVVGVIRSVPVPDPICSLTILPDYQMRPVPGVTRTVPVPYEGRPGRLV